MVAPKLTAKPMKPQYRAMVETRRLYNLEFKMCDDTQFRSLVRQYSRKHLTNLLHRIWVTEGVPIPPPTLVFGGGMTRGNDVYSWYYKGVIHLAPDQHNYMTLIHEIVHAMGYETHDVMFVEMYVHLLSTYTKIDATSLINTFKKLFPD